MSRERLLEARMRDVLKLLLRPSLVRPFLAQLDQVDFVTAVTGEKRSAVQALEREFFGKHDYRTEMNRALLEKRGTILGGNAITGAGYYMLIRVLRPAVMVETGVFDGITTSVMLLAMHDNRHGRLTSIDLPAVGEIKDSTHGMPAGQLPPGCLPGWVIPAWLRERHELHLGDSRTLLPKVLAEKGTIDAFFHDSLHTYDHMMFEFDAAWPRLRAGGAMLSDDLYAWGSRNAFQRFCRRHGYRYHSWGALGVFIRRAEETAR